ncbi:MAG: glycoside hydrolase family 43 protein [Sedimentisphaerales bacterium]|nr:glycoside hydrolase family 43 protein [Sedimentisphaerales bacterium]
MKRILYFCMLMSAMLLCSCSSKSVTLTYSNPLWDGYLADPHMVKFGDTYYAYGTEEKNTGKRFQIARSKDFVNWEYVGGALEPLPGMELYWAPEVTCKDGKYYLYYAGDMHMRVAVSDSPEGPFIDSGKKLFPDLPFSIDGHAFQDPVTKQWYLFFAMDFFDQRPGTALAVVQLSDDMLSVKGEIKTVMRAFADWQIYQRDRFHYDKTWKAWHTVEGPTLVYRDNKYYCFYSGGNWQTPGYGVGCAVSDNVMGPYTDNWSEQGASVLSTIGNELIGPGHNSLIQGPDGQTWFIAYHSWNSQQTARQLCMDPIIWTNEGPKCYQPARGAKTVTIPLVQ